MIATMTYKTQTSTLLALKVSQPVTRSIALTALLLTLLPSCGILPKREPIKMYEPAIAQSAAPADWPQANWSLLVAKPVAGQWLDSDRISVRPAPGAVQVYKGASWSESVPDMVQTALLRKLEDSGRILSVSRPGAGVRGEYQLLTEIRAFESVYGQAGQPQARIEIYAKLVHTADGHAVAARSFVESEAASSEEVPAVVDAFSRSMERATTQIAGWTLSSGNASQAAPGGKADRH